MRKIFLLVISDEHEKCTIKVIVLVEHLWKIYFIQFRSISIIVFPFFSIFLLDIQINIGVRNYKTIIL